MNRRWTEVKTFLLKKSTTFPNLAGLFLDSLETVLRHGGWGVGPLMENLSKGRGSLFMQTVYKVADKQGKERRWERGTYGRSFYDQVISSINLSASYPSAMNINHRPRGKGYKVFLESKCRGLNSRASFLRRVCGNGEIHGNSFRWHILLYSDMRGGISIKKKLARSWKIFAWKIHYLSGYQKDFFLVNFAC